jgi:hypothetical protein
VTVLLFLLFCTQIKLPTAHMNMYKRTDYAHEARALENVEEWSYDSLNLR